MFNSPEAPSTTMNKVEQMKPYILAHNVVTRDHSDGWRTKMLRTNGNPPDVHIRPCNTGRRILQGSTGRLSSDQRQATQLNCRNSSTDGEWRRQHVVGCSSGKGCTSGGNQVGANGIQLAGTVVARDVVTSAEMEHRAQQPVAADRRERTRGRSCWCHRRIRVARVDEKKDGQLSVGTDVARMDGPHQEINQCRSVAKVVVGIVVELHWLE